VYPDRAHGNQLLRWFGFGSGLLAQMARAPVPTAARLTLVRLV